MITNEDKKIFDNYLKTKRNKMKLHTYDYYMNLYASSYNKLILHLQQTPPMYISYAKFISNYLFRSNMFFTTQDKLIGLQNTKVIFSGPMEFFSYLSSLSNEKELNIDFNNAFFQKLYNLFYSYIKSYADIPYPYNSYIANVYKSIASNPQLYDIFMNPDSLFCFINKELCIINSYQEFSLDVLNKLQIYCKSPKKLVPLLNTLSKIVSETSFHTSAPCCSSNYSFNFIAKETIFHAYFNNEGISYERNKYEYMSDVPLVNFDNLSEINISQKVIDSLYMITGGIKQNMDNFSRLCALIRTNYYKNIIYTLPSKNCSPLSLFIVYAPQDQATAIRFWLENILLSTFIESDYQIKDITKSQNILNLIMQNFLSPTYIPIKPSISAESDAQIKAIKKLIRRREIKVKDDYGLYHTLINHLPVICFVDNPKQLTWLQTNFKTKVFAFTPSTSLSVANYKLKESEELACFLSIYGLKLLYDSNHRNKTNIEWQNQTKSITENFIEDCLKPDDKSVLYAENLYKIYTNYYKLFYGGAPLTHICFTKELRRLLADKSIPYQYKKPRSSRSDNRYAFVGIKIDREKAKNAADRATEMRNNADKSSFANYLIDMQNSVNEILQSLHHELYEQ